MWAKLQIPKKLHTNKNQHNGYTVKGFFIKVLMYEPTTGVLHKLFFKGNSLGCAFWGRYQLDCFLFKRKLGQNET